MLAYHLCSVLYDTEQNIVSLLLGSYTRRHRQLSLLWEILKLYYAVLGCLMNIRLLLQWGLVLLAFLFVLLLADNCLFTVICI